MMKLNGKMKSAKCSIFSKPLSFISTGLLIVILRDSNHISVSVIVSIKAIYSMSSVQRCWCCATVLVLD